MGTLQKEPRFVEHARDCVYALDKSGLCNCFLSANTEVLASTSKFRVATTDGPSGVDGSLNEQAQTALQEFISGKSAQHGKAGGRTNSATDLYQPLLAGEIRVLELHPGQYNDPLKGSLHVVSIDFSYPYTKMNGTSFRRYTNHTVSLVSKGPMWYTALSYTWGFPVFDQTISFEQATISITSSLACALRHLRSTSHSANLWIDQVCINQPDMKEKVTQIPLMEQIYSKATNTLIWLGDDENGDASLAFDSLETMYGRLQGGDAQITTEDFERLHFPPAEDRSWWAIRQLLRRPWFTRLWTIQEAYLSRELFIACGRAVANWDDFAVWCSYLAESGLLRWLLTDTYLDQKYSEQHLTTLGSPQGAAVVNSIQADRLHGLTLVHKKSLLDILVSTRYAQATESKDKIYGVLGIAESTIVPDYTPATSARNVYHEACLTQLPLLIYELLSCVDHDVPLQPSWIPDWGSPRVTDSLGYSTKAWTLYRAGGVKVAGQQIKVDLSEDKKQVTLSGKVFDSISTIGPVSQVPVLDILDPQVKNQDLTSYAVVINTTQTYPVSNTSVYQAFFHTLLAGRDGSGVSPPSQDHSEVFSLILDSTMDQMPSLPGQTYSPRRQKGFFTLNSLKSRKPAKTLEDMRIAYRTALKYRRFAVSGKGYFALVPRGTQKNDQIVVFEGSCVPFVVRKRLDDVEPAATYELLGEAYVHGIMRSEVMEMTTQGLIDITLV